MAVAVFSGVPSLMGPTTGSGSASSTPRNYDNPALHFLNHRRAFVTDEAAGEGSATIGSASTALVPWDYNTESFSNHKNPTDIQL